LADRSADFSSAISTTPEKAYMSLLEFGKREEAAE
jgi:hypothetical protein